MPAPTHQAFVCVPLLGVRLSRSACGKRHVRVRREGRGEVASAKSGGRLPKVPAEDCSSCPVGAAHARGQRPKSWPDGTPIELVTLRLGVSSPPERPVVAAPEKPTSRKPEREEDRVKKPRKKPSAPRGQTYSLGEEKKTAYGWAMDPRNTSGISGAGLNRRLVAGWPVHDALTTPRGGGRLMSKPEAA